MTDSSSPAEPPPPSDKPDTDGESLHDRLQRMRTAGAEEPATEPTPQKRAPRVARKEPARRVREQERVAAMREQPARPREPQPAGEPPSGERRKAGARKRAAEPGPAAEPGQTAEAGPAAESGQGGEPEPAVRAAEEGAPPTTGEAGDQGEVVAQLAQRLAGMRAERGWSLQDLAKRTGVSRSNLSRIERGEVSPTIDALMRLAAAYGQSLAGLVAEVESQPRSLVRAAEQAVTGEDAWRRRVVSPPYPGLAGSVTDAQLLPGTDVTYDPPIAGAEQHLWLITGSLEVTLAPSIASGVASEAASGGTSDDPEVRAEREGDFVLIRGDCLRLRLWGPARLRCLSPDPVRYALFTVAPQ